MPNLVQQWLPQLGLEPLPAIESTCKKIQSLLQRHSANYAKFTDIIRHDPGFSLAALRAINATRPKNKPPIIDVSLALPLLGMAWLESTAATLPRINNRYSETQRNAIIHCYSQAIHASYYAFYMATQQKTPDASQIANMALLRNIGEMALLLNPSPLAHKIQTLTYKGMPIDKAVSTCLGITLESLNRALYKQWNLANLDPLLYHPDHTHVEYKIFIDLAYKISQSAENNCHHQATLNALKLTAEYLNSDPDKLTSKIHSITAEIAHAIAPLGLPCSAFNLLFIPQKMEENPPTATEQKSDLSQTSISATKPMPPTSPSQTPAPTPQPPRQIPTNIKRNSRSPTQQLILRTMQDIQELDRIKRVVFIMLTRDRKELIARLTLDNGAHSKIEQFKTNTSKHDLFSILLRKPQAIWIDSEKLVEYARLMPQLPYSLLESDNFFAMSLFSKTRPIGLIYADNGTNGTKPDTATYHNFKRLCQRISNELKQQ